MGLTTLDLIYQVAAPPTANQKLVASNYIMAAGGPATNAAIAFQYLNQQNQGISLTESSNRLTTLLSVLGHHPISHMVRSEVEQWGVAIADLQPLHPDPVATSSIMVTAATGERAVVSLNAVKCVAKPDQIPAGLDQKWDQIGVVLIDGHQMKVGETIAHRANQEGIPVVVDGGSWKPGFEKVLSAATYVICSENFCPPGCQTATDVHRFLQDLGVLHVAITHGANPIEYWDNRSADASPSPDLIDVPDISPVDTLGAGDIFHGAFCYYVLEHPLDIPTTLRQSAQIAAKSCTCFGPRQWMR